MPSDSHKRKSEKRAGFFYKVDVQRANPLIIIAFSAGLKSISRRVSFETILSMSFCNKLKSITEKIYDWRFNSRISLIICLNLSDTSNSFTITI